MNLRAFTAACVAVAAACLVNVTDAATLLLRNPSLAAERIAFLYADDVWTVARGGGDARRLTSAGNVAYGPYYSPDGAQIAYSSRDHGLVDVYVTGADGGVPRRLTWEPTGSRAIGWSADGKYVLFASMHGSASAYERIFRVRADGVGPTEALPLPSADHGAFAADGKTFAYVPINQWQAAWKQYRGGQTTPIWLVNMQSLDIEKVPRDNSNDSHPVWVGDAVYFLSDRNGAVSLFSYDRTTHQVQQQFDNRGFDLKTLSASGPFLAYEQFGSLHLFDTRTHQDQVVNVTIRGDLPQLVQHLEQVPARAAANLDVSPSGARVVTEARGDIFTLPAEKGDSRNLTQTPGVAERDPAWSPDGKSIAYFSDASGEYQLYIRDQDGIAPPKVIDLGHDASFFYSLHWSPDSKHIAYFDKHLRIWYVDAAGGTPVKVDTGLRGGFGTATELAWSPDSRWLSYTRDLESQLHAVFFYSLTTHTATQITDGMSNAANPAFDPNGKYFYFTASTNNGPSDAGIDLSSLDRATSSGVYVVVLARTGESPIPPESDDEKAKAKDQQKDKAKDKTKDKDKDKEKDRAEATVVDLPGIGDRILSLPIPARNYVGLQVGKSGVLFLAEATGVGRPSVERDPVIRSLWRFTTEKRQTEELLGNLAAYKVSFDGEKLFYVRGDAWFMAPIAELKPGSPDAPQGKPVNNGGMTAVQDLRAQWQQMYRETWRIQRDFLYDPHLHGLDLAKIQAKYAPYVDAVVTRAEFSYLSEEMLGEVRVGHMFIRGPEQPKEATQPGLLGADYALEQGRYRFAKVYNGQNWTPSLTAPLTLPGINIVAGDYLLAVNGRELRASDNIDAALDGTAGKQTVLRVAKDAQGNGARNVTVVPTASEYGLRNLDWIDANRRKVAALSGGKVAYVYMPNTAGAGYTNFNRYFYAQLDKQALVLDERYNQGGFIADYVVNLLGQKPLSNAIERDGEPVHDPIGAIFGPKAMIINQSAGSGGDAMPWYFRKAGLGTLVGTRTWGGLVGIGGYPELLDGGAVTAPRYAIYGLNGDWEVEGHGIPPDVEVEELPKDVAGGHDAQLERAVAVVLQQLQLHPLPKWPLPPYPNYHPADGLGTK